MFASGPGNGPCNPGKGNNAKDKESPLSLYISTNTRRYNEALQANLVAGLHERTNETSDDHHLIDQDGEQNGGPW